jgi:hypothetical protein
MINVILLLQHSQEADMGTCHQSLQGHPSLSHHYRRNELPMRQPADAYAADFNMLGLGQEH